MSNVGDALTGGGSAASGGTDSTFADASLGDQIMGGDGSIFGGGDSSTTGPNEFGQLINAFAGGGSASPQAAQASTMSPPTASNAAGGDATGAASGTQSNAQPGSTPAQGGGQQPPQQPDDGHAPPSAVAELRALLKGLAGQPTGPTGPVQQPGGGFSSLVPQPSPLMRAAAALTGSSPAAARLPPVAPGETGPQSPGAGPGFPGSQPGGAGDIEPDIPRDDEMKFDPATRRYTPQPGFVRADDQGNPITAAGTRADQTPLPPPRPTPEQTADAGDGGNITVQPRAQPQAAGEPLPTHTPLPTHKSGPAPAPIDTQPSRLIQDVSGMSTGSPIPLAQLAQAAITLAPLIASLFSGGGRRHHGFGRFGGFRGGMRAMGLHGGRHPFAPGGWPYHHPQFGWHIHGGHPGPGWLPLSPMDAQTLVGGGQQGGPDPDHPPKETGAEPGTPESTPTSGAIPGVGAKDVDDYTRQAAAKWGIDPDTASKILAQESSYGQARRPGDNGTSFGPFQLHFAPDQRAMGDDFMRDTGLDPRDPSTWKAQVDYAMKRAAMGGWKPWTTTMNKLGLNPWSGITTDRRFAGQQRTNKQPKWASNPNIDVTPTTLPPTSQPMVAGQ